MNTPTSFAEIARVPMSGDNVAIATRRVEAATRVVDANTQFELSHTILEGHRFARTPIGKGAELLSWGLPFGIASRDIRAGEYVCNKKIIRALKGRQVDFELPLERNFDDCVKSYLLDEKTFEPGTQVDRVSPQGTFMGFDRGERRGVGTRNVIVILATNSPSSSFARALAKNLEPLVESLPNIDAVASVTHTEGGGETAPNNLDYVLRTLAGFMVHANVAAVLAVDHRQGSFDNQTLSSFLKQHHYPIADVAHAFYSVEADFDSCLEEAGDIVTSWLPQASQQTRSPQPLSHLKLALQCGGSDAFSGVSGNALAGWVAKELVRHGGSANLAETDELIGAEPYVLANVRDVATAKAFLEKIENFKRYAGHHGTTAEGNPSGGNNYRGLYNIALKSIGAARKKDPNVRLDYVIDYAQPMRDGGFYFMDSPGNDLESIAGQVASGANLILFITGNGSITNFPFVPTLKFVTTSGRFELLANEMDVNAGRYNDGLSMQALGEETFELTRRVAEGQLTKGELAGHAQVSLWRDWPQTDASQVQAIKTRRKPDGQPIAVLPGDRVDFQYQAIPTEHGYATAQLGLVMPTSLCSGQPARLIAEHMNATRDAADSNQKYVALVHTEGCGSNNTAPILLQTLLGYLQHKSVRSAVLLEHGCEQTHNDTVRQYLKHQNVSTERFGWASVQMDGGLERVRDTVAGWFSQLDTDVPSSRVSVGIGELSLGLTASGSVTGEIARAFGEVARALSAAGASVVVPENSPLLIHPDFCATTIGQSVAPQPTLAYGQAARIAGLHIMETPTENTTETFTGLGATGVDLLLCHVGKRPLQGHPMIPLLQVSGHADVASRYGRDLDLRLDFGRAPRAVAEDIASLLCATASGDYVPRFFARGITDFQLTRGLLGVSM